MVDELIVEYGSGVVDRRPVPGIQGVPLRLRQVPLFHRLQPESVVCVLVVEQLHHVVTLLPRQNLDGRFGAQSSSSRYAGTDNLEYDDVLLENK